jgi:hypothetical protein
MLLLPAAFSANCCPLLPLPTLLLPPGRHCHHRHHRLLSRHAALLSSHHPITALPSCCLIALAGCCVPSSCTALSLSSHRAALLLSCSGWLLRCLPSHRPLVHPFVVLSLHCPLVVSSHWLVVALPVVVPPSCHPLAPPLSRCLAPSGCCINSCCAALSSSCHATPLFSHCPITALTSRCLIEPAGCCVASHCTALSSSSHRAALPLSCSSWLLHCLPSHHPLVLLLCLPLVISLSYHCGTLSLSHLTGWLLHCLSLYCLLVILLLRCSFVVLLRLVIASTLITPPSRPHVVPPPCPLVILSLR